MFAQLSPVALTVGTLAVWRITHLLWDEDGPFNLFVAVRRLAGSGFVGNLLDCFYCLSLWVSIPFAYVLGSGPAEYAALWFGLSGGAILFQRFTTREAVTPPPVAHWREEHRTASR